MNGGADPTPALDEGGGLTPLDLLLGEGTAAEREDLRQRIAADPLQALEMADTVALLESLRQVRVEPSSRLPCRLSDLVRRAGRRVGSTTRAPARPWLLRPPLWAAAAAVLSFGVLSQFDPLGRRAGVPAPPRGCLAVGGGHAPDVRAEPGEHVAVREATEVAWESAVEVMRRRLGMEPSRHLVDALDIGLRSSEDPLQRWLEPRNALALLRADHELRGSAEARWSALRDRGGMPATDARAQELGDLIARELVDRLGVSASEPTVGDVALAVRALIASGASSALRSEALARGSDWLAARAPASSGAGLAQVLSPLVEVAAVCGSHVEAVTVHGGRLVAEVLHADEDTWGRRLPELLNGRVPAATMADAGRVLAFLPGFGVDAGRCRLVRELLLGQLRERRDGGQDGPEILAAMLFGSADLLPEPERDAIEGQLRRWNLLRLAPDFVTALQLAWSIEPARLGFTRMQREIRRLSVLPDPVGLGERAAFCLCLATSYSRLAGGARCHAPELGD